MSTRADGGHAGRGRGRTAFRTLVALCTASLVAGFVVGGEEHFGWADWPAFFALFGFVTFALIVLSGHPLRRVLMRDEDYYDR